MKLFDAIFHILETEKKLELDENTTVHLVHNLIHRANPYFLHRITQSSEEKSYLPRSILEEYFTHLILKHDSKTEQIVDFLYKIEDEFENPFNIHRIKEIAEEASLLDILRADHPKIVTRVQK